MPSDVLVVCFHAVSPRWQSSLSLTPARLAAQLEAVLRRGYVAQTFTAAVTAPAGARVLAVTFDDAYRSVLEHGKPVLDRLGIPATMFAPTRFIDASAPLAWEGTDHHLRTPDAAELEPMTWAELRGLAADGWEVGSHTLSHPHLTRLDDATLAEELTASRAATEAGMGWADGSCTSLAYPYGDVDARVVAAAEAAGYTAAGTLPMRLHEARPLAWPRVGLYERDAAWRLALKAAPSARRLRSSSAWDVLERTRQLGRGATPQQKVAA